MKWLLCIVALLTSGFANAEVTVTDVISAAQVVSIKMGVSVSTIVLHREPNPLGVAWRPMEQACHIYISSPNVKYLDKLIGNQPMVPMLEGFLAHEIAHCVEMKAKVATSGVASLASYNSNIDVRVKAETIADIVAIMYWKQEYPAQAARLIDTMISWRKSTHGTDTQHATYPTLEKALPLIPARVSVSKAVAIRSFIEDR